MSISEKTPRPQHITAELIHKWREEKLLAPPPSSQRERESLLQRQLAEIHEVICKRSESIIEDLRLVLEKSTPSMDHAKRLLQFMGGDSLLKSEVEEAIIFCANHESLYEPFIAIEEYFVNFSDESKIDKLRLHLQSIAGYNWEQEEAIVDDIKYHINTAINNIRETLSSTMPEHYYIASIVRYIAGEKKKAEDITEMHEGICEYPEVRIFMSRVEQCISTCLKSIHCEIGPLLIMENEIRGGRDLTEELQHKAD